jgi:hypothetical protein
MANTLNAARGAGAGGAWVSRVLFTGVWLTAPGGGRPSAEGFSSTGHLERSGSGSRTTVYSGYCDASETFPPVIRSIAFPPISCIEIRLPVPPPPAARAQNSSGFGQGGKQILKGAAQCFRHSRRRVGHETPLTGNRAAAGRPSLTPAPTRHRPQSIPSRVAAKGPVPSRPRLHRHQTRG